MKNDIYKYDIENGLASLKVGIKNLISYLSEQPNGTKKCISGIHIDLVKQCIYEQHISNKTRHYKTGVNIDLVSLGIIINCLYDTDEIEFYKYEPELHLEF